MATGTIQRPIDAGVVQLTLTRTENTLVNSTSFARLHAYKKNGVLYLLGNLQVAASAATSDFVKIGSVSGWAACDSFFQNIPPQNATGLPVLTVQITNDGEIKIFFSADLSASAFYRFGACVLEA